ncbi:MAG: DUF4329 domain-containing protein, partial [Prevotella sp.]|nr:DUF4329 domain-containing protein [Prevotella sp.]
TPYSDHTATGVSLQKYKYNGKELDLTHGLNTYDYGARQYYSVLLRWDRLDPLCEKYYHVSPYVYCMNNPVKFVDYKGFAPGDFFFTVNEAAIDFGMYYNDNSIRDKVEYGSSIFRVVNDKGQRGYTYTVANRGKTTAVVCRAAPFGYKTVAEIHSHGHSTAKELKPYLDNDFSGLTWADDNNIVQGQKLKDIDTDTDIGHANKVQRDSFITTPNGSLKKYEHRTGKVTLISTDMPSDYNDPDRKNNRSYLIEANPIKVNTEVEQERKMSLYGNY